MRFLLLIASFTLSAISFTLNAQGQQQYFENNIISQLKMEIDALEEDDFHCEVPCGIYGDSLRVQLIKEHIRTVEKAMTQVIALSDDENPNYNQIVRWVMNKEKHAEEIQHIVSQYFLHQRIKPVDENDINAVMKYNKHLKHLHHTLVFAMKCKQGTDLNNIEKINAAVDAFSDAYFHKH